MSSNLNGWKYDVMKLENRKPVDVESWQQPVKLNRKELRREGPDDVVQVQEAVGPMLGPDGKPVIGSDGKMVMVDADGRPIHRNSGESSSSKPAKEKAVGGRKKFQKKTKQVFLVPEATRLLRKEERYPWVLEDSSGSQVWTGMLEDLNKAETHAMFLPTAENIFKFVPPHRWYKFQKRPNYKVPSLEEAEKLMAQYAKQKNPEKWLSNRTKTSDPSGSGVKVEEGVNVNSHIPTTVSLVHDAGQSFGPGGKKLRAVDSGMNGLFGDDDEEELDFKRKREREYGADGDGDEIDFEEDFADDEEKNPEEADDDEAKELEERLKKEYRKAGVTKQADFVEDSDDEDEEKLTGAGKAMKKMLKKSDKNGQYDNSDDEKNPYASSEEEEEEVDPAQTWTGPAIQAPPPRPGSQRPTAPPAPAPTINTKSQPTIASTGSRPTSPTLGGHSVVAQRATSPKAPNKVGKTSRASSPLAQGSVSAQPNSRATSPATVSRAGSPSSPGAPVKLNGKRKAGEDGSSAPSPPQNGAPKAKKRKGPGGSAPAEELEDKAVIEWLRNTPNANTRDCIAHFKPYLTDEAKKTKFTALIKEAAQLKGGVLVLRSAYRSSPQQSPEPQTLN